MPTTKNLTIAIAVCLFHSSVTAAEPRTADAWEQEIARAANEEIEESGAPSLQIAVGQRGELVFEGAYGLADVENNVVATTETKYRTASVSKWWTTAAALLLVEQKKLDLDRPIQAYCPSFPPKEWPITTRQLITHTSGIRHYADWDSRLSEATSDSERRRIERQRRLAELSTYTRFIDRVAPLEPFKDDELLFEPGTEWQYSSFGYRVLGCVLEGASDESYRSLMERTVFGPLGMSNTVEDDAWAIIPHRASGYRLDRGEPLRRADLRDVSENLPAGGHLSTATDLVRFGLAISESRLVSAEARALMFSPLTGTVEPGPSSWRDAIPSKEKYGYGVMFFPAEDRVWLGHTGRQAGGSAIVVVVPDKHIVIAVMTNVKGWNGYIDFIRSIEGIIGRALAVPLLLDSLESAITEVVQ